MKLALKIFTAGLFSLFTLFVLYCVWALIAYRDIPVEVLEQKYGGENLRVLDVEGVPVRYKLEGSPAAPTMVLVHSHYWTMRQWQVWIDTLGDQFQFLRFDYTSHGLTGPDPDGDYSREKSAVIIDALLSQHDIESATFVGSSSGGAISFHYAATRPDKVENLVLINTPGVKVTNKAMDAGLPKWVGYAFYLMPTTIFRPFLEFAVVDKSLITDEMVKEFHDMYRRDGNRMAEYKRMSAWEPSDPAEVLAKVTAPTLIVWGKENPQLPVSSVDDFKARLINSPRVDSIVYPDIGHVIPIENPRQAAQDVAEFIRSN